MRPSRRISLALGITALVLLPATQASAQKPADQHLKIENRSSEPVTVRVLHSDGELQKQETVQPGDNHKFTFSWCGDCCGHDKQRKLEVKTGSTLRATGNLYMHTKQLKTGGQDYECRIANQLTVTDENESDALTFATSYAAGNPTAVLTVNSTPLQGSRFKVQP